jgi:hypothetical protein|tara:strand:- start:110 stop:415 length:306 start_codon:yes stop_codon:yes gene_type:complete
MINHLKQYIGWYFLAASIWLMFTPGYRFEGGLIFGLTLLKIPPFDLVGRAFDLANIIGYSLGSKVKLWKEKQTKPIRVITTIIALIVIFLIFWYMPECELC